MLFFAINAEKSISFTVEHQCPQCGAPIILGEETLFFVCDFCRVRSCIAQKGFARYYFSPSPDIPTDYDIIYLPYWRFKGVRYACGFSGVTHRFLDISALAMEGGPKKIPFSLGFRSQALSLRLVSNETQGKFIQPVAFKTTLQTLDKPGRSLKKNRSPVFQEDIGETTSLIYSPFYIHENRLFDGILNTPIQTISPGDINITEPNLCCRKKKQFLFQEFAPTAVGTLKGILIPLCWSVKIAIPFGEQGATNLEKLNTQVRNPNNPMMS